jgi:outer membrane protein assembly factor BamB
MQTKNSVVPPGVVTSSNIVYAVQGDIYALRMNDGMLLQRYPRSGIARLAVLNDILYMNVNAVSGSVVQAMHHDGRILWRANVGGRLCGNPVVVDDIVYVSIAEGSVIALRASDGFSLWSKETGSNIFVSPTVDGKIVYIASEKNGLSKPSVYALQAENGTLLWQSSLPEATSFSITILEGILYISTQRGRIALRASDGVFLWRYSQDKGDIICSPLTIVEGIAYVSFSTSSEASSQSGPTREAFIRAIRSGDGSMLWEQRIGNSVEVSEPTMPALTDKAIYVGANDGFLYAFQRSDATPLWHQKTGGTMLSSPAVMDGIVYVGANDGYVYAFRADDGNPVWRTFVSTSVTASASIELHLF